MTNIDHFAAVGNVLVQGAPEAVAIAWWAVRQILSAVQDDYKLYSFFGQSLTNITEMMALIRTYDRLYDERTNAR